MTTVEQSAAAPDRVGRFRLPARFTPLETAALVLLLFCVGVVVVVGMVWAPMDYDEGYNLQVPLHLATSGHYATDGALFGGREKPFDVFISTGPTVLLPIGALFAVAGPHLWLARLVPSAGYLLLLSAGWRVGSRTAGRVGGLVVVASLAGLDSIADWPTSAILSTGSVLGEFTAAGLVLLAATVLHRPRLAGTLLGLAALSKVIAVLAVPGFVVGLLVACRRGRHRRAGDTAVALTTSAFAPVLLWQLYVLVRLGPGGYQQHLNDFVAFFGTAGSGLQGTRSGGSSQRLHTLSAALNGPAWWLPLMLLLLAGLSHQAIVGRSQRHRVRPVPSIEVREMLAVLLVTSAGTLLWWLTMAQQAWVRHVVPALLLAIAALTASAVLLLRRACATLGGPRSVTVVTTAVLAWSAVPVLLHAYDALTPPGPTLATQRRAAAVLRELGAPPHHMGWSQNPDLMFLSGRRSTPLDDEGGLLVLPDPPRGARDPRTRDCSRVLRRTDGFLFCEADPTRGAGDEGP